MGADESKRSDGQQQRRRVDAHRQLLVLARRQRHIRHHQSLRQPPKYKGQKLGHEGCYSRGHEAETTSKQVGSTCAMGLISLAAATASKGSARATSYGATAYQPMTIRVKPRRPL